MRGRGLQKCFARRPARNANKKKKLCERQKRLKTEKDSMLATENFFFCISAIHPSCLNVSCEIKKTECQPVGWCHRAKENTTSLQIMFMMGGAHECIGLSGNNVRRISGDGCGTRIGEDRIYALGCAQKKKSLRVEVWITVRAMTSGRISAEWTAGW